MNQRNQNQMQQNQEQEQEKIKQQSSRMAALVRSSGEQMLKLSGGKFDETKVARLAMLTRLAIEKNPQLLDCTPSSLFWSFLDASRCGLEWDGVQGALVPFWNSKRNCREAQFMPMYRGLIQNLVESGAVTDIDAAPVYKDDLFEIRRGTSPSLTHEVKVNGSRDDKDLIAAYAVFWLPSGKPKFAVLNREEILKRKKVSKTSKYGPWVDWFAEMAVKTAVKSGFKMIPALKPQVQTTYSVDSRAGDEDARSLSSVIGGDDIAGVIEEMEMAQPSSAPAPLLDQLEAKAISEEKSVKPKAKKFSIPKKDIENVGIIGLKIKAAGSQDDIDKTMAELPEVSTKAVDAIGAFSFYRARIISGEPDSFDGLPEETVAMIQAVEEILLK